MIAFAMCEKVVTYNSNNHKEWTEQHLLYVCSVISHGNHSQMISRNFLINTRNFEFHRSALIKYASTIDSRMPKNTKGERTQPTGWTDSFGSFLYTIAATSLWKALHVTKSLVIHSIIANKFKNILLNIFLSVCLSLLVT